jgi:prepilin-type N-terminal cleavage/methylation domain-containing protein
MMRKVRGFTLIELMIVVAIVGVLSAVAIPSFIKYLRRSKTTEAMMNLRKMYDGAVAYYVGEHADVDGKIQSRQFPISAPTTPSLAAITAAGGNKVLTQPADWKVGGWAALDFMVTDPAYYAYTYTGNGLTFTDAQASMIAQGDLNANQIYSYFRRDCYGMAEGVRGGSGIYSVNEIE